MHKIKNRTASSSFLEKFEQPSHLYPTRFSSGNYRKPQTKLAVFLPNFQKPAHLHPIDISKLNYVKPMSQLSRSKHRISVRDSALRNKFLTDNEKEIEYLSLFKSKVKSKLLSYENMKESFLSYLCVNSRTNTYQRQYPAT